MATRNIALVPPDPLCLTEHSHVTPRRMHFAGTLLGDAFGRVGDFGVRPVLMGSAPLTCG
jgi:hypothetical protein